jgi:HSP20 family protein
MKNRKAPEARARAKSANRKLIKSAIDLDRPTELQKAIARRAYELFESRGCEHGQDLADWLRAESEILQTLQIKVIEYQDQLTVEAEIPGFSAEEIEVNAESRRLIISGGTNGAEGEEEENTFSREILARDILHLIYLPVDIDANKVESTLTGEILNVTLPKRVAGRPSHARPSAV